MSPEAASVFVYVIGGAVFPGAGAVNPTLTMVALALRAADHIRDQHT